MTQIMSPEEGEENLQILGLGVPLGPQKPDPVPDQEKL